MPFLSIVRRAWVDTLSLIQRFSLGTQKRRSCRFGSQRRLVLLFACDTLCPDCARLPVTWQTLAMCTLLQSVIAALGQDGVGPADAGKSRGSAGRAKYYNRIKAKAQEN